MNESFTDFFFLTKSGRNPGSQKEDQYDKERERSFSTGQPLLPYKKQGYKQFSHGASQAASCSTANPKAISSTQDRRERPGRGDGRPNSKSPGMNDPYGIDIAP